MRVCEPRNAALPRFARVFVAVALLAIAVPAVAGAADKAPARRPNVVLILTDDQRWDTMSCVEKPLLGIKTPHLDRLAKEGARFRNMFCTTSLCSPSRASFLSGLYAHSHGIKDNFTDYPRDLASYPRQLKQEGYATAYIGKWHMGEEDDSPRPGFDYWASHKGQGTYFDTEFNINGARSVLKGYYAARVTDLAIDWMAQQKAAPFCLILGHKAPHGPFVPEPKYEHTYDDVPVNYPDSAFKLSGKPEWIKERLVTWHGIYGPLYAFRKDFPDPRPEGVEAFSRFVKSYTAVINSVDDSVGRVYAALEKSGQLDNTIFIFTSDNGFLLGEHGMIDKRTMHEESIRVPLLIRYPQAVPAGKVYDEMVASIDIAPTVLELCGAKPLPKVHGRSLVDVIDQVHDWRQVFYYEYNYEKQFPYTPNVRGIRTDTWKYVHYPHGDGKPDRHLAELYDLEHDPQELKNLIADPAHAAKLAELKELLVDEMDRVDALPDAMPIDEGIKTELPDAKIR